MGIDLDRASAFMFGNARILDQRRLAVRINDGDATSTRRQRQEPDAGTTTDIRRRWPDDTTSSGSGQCIDDGMANRRAVLAAVDGYRNPDGGYAWGLEPDLRAPESQPAGALHALEAIGDAAPVTSPSVPGLLDWLASVTPPDGGLPFALPIADPIACAPFWASADLTSAGHTVSSLQISAAVAAQAHRVGSWDNRVRNHPWLANCTQYCFAAIKEITEQPFAYVLSFALQFLDAAAEQYPEAHELFRHLGQFVPPDGVVPVVGGAEGEVLHLLDYLPEPHRPIRTLLDDDAVARHLDRLADGQQSDGGWQVDFPSYSAAAALEWRGYATVRAISVLRMNGR